MFWNYLKGSVVATGKVLSDAAGIFQISVFVVNAAIYSCVAAFGSAGGLRIALAVFTALYGCAFIAFGILRSLPDRTAKIKNLLFASDAARVGLELLTSLLALISAVLFFSAASAGSYVLLVLAVIDAGAVYIYTVARIIAEYVKYQTKQNVENLKTNIRNDLGLIPGEKPFEQIDDRRNKRDRY